MTDKNIHQRILAVMAEVDYVAKGDKMVNKQYTFVSHDTVTARLHPQFVKHGICVVPSVTGSSINGNRTAVELNIQFINADKPDDRIEIQYIGYGIDPQDKGPGKAVSYAYKYALLKLFALETGDDPERDIIDFKPDHADHIEKKNNKYVGLTGPHKTKTGLQDALKALTLDIESMGAHDELEGLLNDNRETIQQVKKDFPRWWEGYDDFVGLEDRIDNKFKQFEAEELERGI